MKGSWQVRVFGAGLSSNRSLALNSAIVVTDCVSHRSVQFLGSEHLRRCLIAPPEASSPFKELDTTDISYKPLKPRQPNKP